MRYSHRLLVSVLLLTVLWTCDHAGAQTIPVITAINPSSVTAGGQNFALTVTGSGFAVNSVVQINGSNRPTVFMSPLQVTATIFASDVSFPAALQVTVFNPLTARPGITSNAVMLTITTAVPGPSLTSISPEFASRGAERIRMTLVGANFRPGATVVISPPIPGVNSSNGHTRASDIQIVSVTRVNSTLMTAIISASPTALIGVRAVDALNIDGTSTAGSLAGGPGTSQPIRVESSISLGAPLSILNMALIHPRDGTVLQRGQELNAEAVLAGTGTGTVIGQWVWGVEPIQWTDWTGPPTLPVCKSKVRRWILPRLRRRRPRLPACRRKWIKTVCRYSGRPLPKIASFPCSRTQSSAMEADSPLLL